MKQANQTASSAISLLLCTIVAVWFWHSAGTRLYSGQAQAQSVSDSTLMIDRSWTALPSLFYSPRTRWGGGGSVRFFPRREYGTRPTNIAFSFIYTTRKQMIISLVPDLFFKTKRRRLYSSILYFDFPDVFYGIGNDTRLDDTESYTARTVSFLVSGEQEIAPDLSMGLQTWVRNERVRDTDQDPEPESETDTVPDPDPDELGILEQGLIPGSTQGTAIGTGLFFRWDTRDNLFYTTNGSFIRAAFMLFPSELGSDFAFSRTTLDMRRYFPLNWRFAVALRSYNQATTGTTPFQLLPQVGGNSVMRGYAEGRYRDNISSVVQAELRGYIWGPVSAALFGSIGDVQERFSQLGSDTPIAALGGGIRLLVNDEGLNFRVDYAYGREGGRLYFTLGEAF